MEAKTEDGNGPLEVNVVDNKKDLEIQLGSYLKRADQCVVDAFKPRGECLG